MLSGSCGNSKRNRGGVALRHILFVPLALVLALWLSCSREKKAPEPPKATATHDLAGEWQSDIESGGQVIAKSIYAIEQRDDTVSLSLTSTKSPQGEELVPTSMWFKATGTWQNDALRLAACAWISGRDTCRFFVRGDVDKEGRILLHFPGDICGERSLPYTRKLCRPEAGAN